MINSFAESTIRATCHLICHEPAKLKAWLEKHPPGLEKAAREYLERGWFKEPK